MKNFIQNSVSLLLALCVFSNTTRAQEATKSHISSDKMFIITHPESWKVNRAEQANAEFCVNAPEAGMMNPSMVKAVISKVEEGYEDADIKEIAEVEMKMLKAQPEKNMNMEILNSKFEKKGGHEWWVYNGKIPKGKKFYMVDYYKTLHKGKMYIFMYFSTENSYEKNKAAAEKIIASVEFLTKS